MPRYLYALTHEDVSQVVKLSGLPGETRRMALYEFINALPTSEHRNELQALMWLGAEADTRADRWFELVEQAAEDEEDRDQALQISEKAGLAELLQRGLEKLWLAAKGQTPAKPSVPSSTTLDAMEELEAGGGIVYENIEDLIRGLHEPD